MYVTGMFIGPSVLPMAVPQGAYHVTMRDTWQCHAGKVRKECVEGLRRVVGLRRVEWARQVDSLNLLPTCLMLNLLDKKFGGELTKEDVQVHSVNPETSILFQKRHFYTGTLNSETSGDTTKTFPHCGDVLGQHACLASFVRLVQASCANC